MNPKSFWFLIFSSIRGQVISQEFKICLIFFLQRKPYVGGYSSERKMLIFLAWRGGALQPHLLDSPPLTSIQHKPLSHLPGFLDLGRMLVASHWKTNIFFNVSCFFFNWHIEKKDENEASVADTVLHVPFTTRYGAASLSWEDTYA